MLNNIFQIDYNYNKNNDISKPNPSLTLVQSPILSSGEVLWTISLAAAVHHEFYFLVYSLTMKFINSLVPGKCDWIVDMHFSYIYILQ